MREAQPSIDDPLTTLAYRDAATTAALTARDTHGEIEVMDELTEVRNELEAGRTPC